MQTLFIFIYLFDHIVVLVYYVLMVVDIDSLENIITNVLYCQRVRRLEREETLGLIHRVSFKQYFKIKIYYI